MYRLVNSAFGFVNTKRKVLLMTPNRRGFGECANDMYYGLLKAQHERKRVLFIYTRSFIFKKLGFSLHNREYFDLESEHIISSNGFSGFILGSILTIYVLFLHCARKLRDSIFLRGFFKPIWPIIKYDAGYILPLIGREELWKPYNINNFSWDIAEKQNWSKRHEEYIPPKLKVSKKLQAERIRIQMGIGLNEWFVCLHVRAIESRPFRNASIQNYIEGIKAITDAGGWVVRLGEPGLPKLPVMEKVIDYANSPYKSELMDIYLISECRFFLGHSSGPNIVANLFRKPLLLVNMTEWVASTLLKKGDLGIMKHVFSYSRNRYLSIKEVFEEPSLVQFDGIPAEDYEIVENSSEEIREAIEEFLTRQDPYVYSISQNLYNEVRMKELRRCLEKGEPTFVLGVPEKNLYLERYRIAADIFAHGTLCENYLKKNWLIDKKKRD